MALMMVLWIFVLLSIIALNHLSSTRHNSAATRNMKEETLSYYMALSGYHEAVEYIMSDKDQTFDFHDSDGNYRVDKDTPPVTGKRTTPEGEIEILISDEDSKININTAPPESLRRLFMNAGVKEEALNEVIDCIMDWRDPDKEHRLMGAEDEYYEALEEPYKTKNAPFDVPEELLLVKGMKPEHLYGGSDLRSVLPLVTTFGSGAMNINTASREVMEMMGLSSFEIEFIMKQRNPESGGLRLVPPDFIARGFSSMTSNNLRIEVTGRAANSKVSSKITAVINRQFRGKGYKVQTMYWRENADYGRS
ncbi:MAG: general secretion pathway protein GspK [Nitrospirae bacterium]|nr:general secretion pathway protein GspK [Nitrospirota bacterium]